MDVWQCRYRPCRKKGTESEDRVEENGESKSLESCRFLDERKGKTEPEGEWRISLWIPVGRRKW